MCVCVHLFWLILFVCLIDDCLSESHCSVVAQQWSRYTLFCSGPCAVCIVKRKCICNEQIRSACIVHYLLISFFQFSLIVSRLDTTVLVKQIDVSV